MKNNDSNKYSRFRKKCLNQVAFVALIKKKKYHGDTTHYGVVLVVKKYTSALNIVYEINVNDQQIKCYGQKW